MVVYIDTLIVVNFLFNYLLLLLAVKMAGIPFLRWRMACAALIGAAYALLILIPDASLAVSLLGKTAFGIAMAAIAFVGLPWRRFARVTLVFFGVSFAFGGCVMAIGMATGQNNHSVPYLAIDFKILLLAGGLCYGILALVFRRAGKHEPTEKLDVTITANGRRVTLPALLDSGNTLQDPLSGHTVLVAEWESLLPLLPRDVCALLNTESLKNPITLIERISVSVPHWSSRFRLIPYKAVGVSCGFLLAFRPDMVIVGKGKRPRLLVALSPTSLSDGGEYVALVGAS